MHDWLQIGLGKVLHDTIHHEFMPKYYFPEINKAVANESIKGNGLLKKLISFGKSNNWRSYGRVEHTYFITRALFLF